jgi:GMP synthase-like glutamine amidotransferase
MRHINRPIYSVQFHPETHFANYTYRNQYDEEIIKEAKQYGEEIIINFAHICNQ